MTDRPDEFVGANGRHNPLNASEKKTDLRIVGGFSGREFLAQFFRHYDVVAMTELDCLQILMTKAIFF